jgi:hypothetical protein
MITALLTWFSLRGGFSLPRGLGVALVLAVLLALGGFGTWRAMVSIERMIAAGAEAARETERLAWQAQIMAANAEAEHVRAEAAVAAARASAAAEQTMTGLRAALAELERRNETMPGGAHTCLDAGDLDDLNRLRQRP